MSNLYNRAIVTLPDKTKVTIQKLIDNWERNKLMRITVWNTKENRPATSEEVDQLVADGDLYINYHIKGSVNIGVVWMELSNMVDKNFHLVHETNDQPIN